MKRTLLPTATIALVLLAGAIAVYASSNGPPRSRTGAPSESTCLGCHSGNATNTGGMVELLDAPAFYRAGRQYTLRLRLTSSQTTAATSRVWGFQATAINPADGTGVGTFATIAGQGTGLISGAGALASRTYVEQVSAGLHSGAASPVEWQFQWTAPNPGTGPIRFYFVGLAANGNGGTSGDWMYQATFDTEDTTTAAVPTTLGSIKDRYLR